MNQDSERRFSDSLSTPQNKSKKLGGKSRTNNADESPRRTNAHIENMKMLAQQLGISEGQSITMAAAKQKLDKITDQSGQ